MRLIFVFLALSVAAWSQAMTEAAAAAAGGSVGGVAGKKVGEGVGSILEKVAASAAKAADGKDVKPAAPALEVGQGVPKPGALTPTPSKSGSKPAVAKASKPDRSLVPPPPPLPHRGPAQPETAPAPVAIAEVVAPPPPPPPPPVVTPEDLKRLSNGMERVAVLKLGPPASRVSMAEAGHLLEIYNYVNRDKNFGTVRLSDGVVASIELH